MDATSALSTASAAETALLLGPGGEFAFVILGARRLPASCRAGSARDLLLVDDPDDGRDPGPGPPRPQRLSRGSKSAAPLDPAPPVRPADDEAGRVIIAGFGRVGQLVGEMLERHKVPYLAIDMDPARACGGTEDRQAGLLRGRVQPEFLRACGIERARALVVTLDTRAPSRPWSRARRAPRPHHRGPRPRRAHATQLYELGVDDAVPETIEASLQLSEAVLVDIGVPMGLVIASIHERRDEFRDILRRSRAASAPKRAVFQARRRVGKRPCSGAGRRPVDT